MPPALFSLLNRKERPCVTPIPYGAVLFVKSVMHPTRILFPLSGPIVSTSPTEGGGITFFRATSLPFSIRSPDIRVCFSCSKPSMSRISCLKSEMKLSSIVGPTSRMLNESLKKPYSVLYTPVGHESRFHEIDPLSGSNILRPSVISKD